MGAILSNNYMLTDKSRSSNLIFKFIYILFPIYVKRLKKIGEQENMRDKNRNHIT